MLFKDTAIFALVMILMGILLTAALIAAVMTISLIAGGKGSPAKRWRIKQ
jgi:hypothetical protein